jgi:hypothetical protein
MSEGPQKLLNRNMIGAVFIFLSSKTAKLRRNPCFIQLQV